MIFFSPNSRCFPAYVIFLVTLVLCMIPAMAASGNDTDLVALLDIKSRISQDPFQIMAGWNESGHYCQWEGITCNPSNERVVMIDLSAKQLVGSVPQSIGNLTYLTSLNLRNNTFRGKIPQEIGRLLLLQQLNLTYNALSGDIPINLTYCKELRFLDLVYNELVGQIPDQLSSLSKLEFLGLGGNNFTGSLPAWIGNFSSLRIITLALNSFQGGIPPELGRLSRLRVFQVYGNELSGTVPLSIYNISSIYYFSVTQNKLHGEIPPYVGLSLPNLQIFAGGVNSFTGQIPVSLSNASKLALLDFAQNGLTGTVPTVLGKLPNLIRINFDDNKLGSRESGDLDFISSLTNCTALEVLGLSRNSFGGELPMSIANLSVKLNILTLGGNLFHGKVPAGIGNLVNLNVLGLEQNFLGHSLPDSLGNFKSVQGLSLNDNEFSGLIPSSIGNLTSLTRLYLYNNRLEGKIPSELGKCRSLQILSLIGNNLNGSIPAEVTSLSSLSILLAISRNSLSGFLPLEVGKLINLNELDLSENKLSGEIPSGLSSCLSLERLALGGNLLQGTIPESLKTLRGIVEMNFSHNNLSGEIPEFLSKLSSLKKLDLSFNNFIGKVPTQGVFSNASAFSLAGNEKLCGGVPGLNLPECTEFVSKRQKFRELKVLIPAIVSIVFLVFLFCALAAYCALKPSSSENPSTSIPPYIEDWEHGISFGKVFSSTNGFSADNLLGSGSFGTVYKGVLDEDGPIVAVKVLNLQQTGASKSFMDELVALRSIRHRNLVKILAACSTTDPRGHDFKCLVFEFMSKGNLDQWLHPISDDQFQPKSLDIVQRLNIAMDIASALDYLHNYCEKPIVHCDLKPSNILLDENMTAHVGDFGLARFLLEDSNQADTVSAGLKGSIGYIPPEYASGCSVSTSGDVYSFGILLLELFTGKRPTDDMFKDGLNIHQFVTRALDGHVMGIVDPYLLLAGEKSWKDEKKSSELEEQAILNNNLSQNSSRSLEECLVSVLKVGLSCSQSFPLNRMPMSIVVNRMQEIREVYTL